MPLVLMFMFSSFPKSAFASQKILVRRDDAGLQVDARSPAELAKPADIEQLARRSVGLALVEFERAAEADGARHRASQVRNGLVLAASDINKRQAVGSPKDLAKRIVRKVHHHRAGIGHVVAVQEFPPR